jgi:hypothetical protein
MIHVGKCPKCDRRISSATIEAIELNISPAAYKGISYLCPSCKTVLSVSLDHVALTNDIAAAVAKRLGKG